MRKYRQNGFNKSLFTTKPPLWETIADYALALALGLGIAFGLYIYVSQKVTMYKIVEINNPLAVHCLCDTLERAEHWINELAPKYCAKGYFMDKTLTPSSFKIVHKS